ncbi:MAG TPA: hypothetical protein VEQ87_16800 [Burkholderiales bacterium]|nr:hypothetical protein [Burkholderiales bacterium]
MKLKLIAAIAAATMALALPAHAGDVFRGKDQYGRPIAVLKELSKPPL